MNQPALQSAARPGLLSRLGGEVKRLVVLAMLGIAVVVAGKYYFVDRLNEEIRGRVEQRLREHYRGLGVSLYSARRLPGRGIELRGLEIRASLERDAAVLIKIDEIFAECDTRLPDFVTRPPQITRVHVQRPRLHAARLPAGEWNLSRLLPLPAMGEGASPPPTATISDGTLEIIDPTQPGATPLAFRNIELVVIPQKEVDQPTGVTRTSTVLRIKGSLAGDHFENAELDGLLDPQTAEWDVRGAVEGLEFNQRLRTALPRELAACLAPLSAVHGRTYMGFSVQRGPRVGTAAVAPPISFVVSGKISEGRIDDVRLPEPLSDVQATIRADNRGVVIQDLSARCGQMHLELDAEMFGYSPGSPFRLEFVARQLEVHRLRKESLPAVLQRVDADFQPRGRVDLCGSVVFDGRTWLPDVVVTCHDLSLKYHRFPYQMVGGTGRIVLRQNHLSVQLRLLAGSQPVDCRAEVDHPGPSFTGWIEAQSAGPITVDEKLLAALEPKFQTVVRPFRPRGMVSLNGRLWRDRGQSQIDRKLTVTLHDCYVQHDRFKYPIDKVNGSLQLTGDNWQFRHLTGRNDSAYILGEGSWTSQPADGQHLKLEFTATDVPLADELRDALSPGAQRLWSNLRPRGNVDHLMISLRYSAGSRQFSVDVKGEKWRPEQNVEGRALSIEPSWFRYRMDNLTGAIHYLDGRIELAGMAATHGRTILQASGHAEVRADGSCRLELTKLSADRLAADSDLFSALPQSVGQGLSRLAVEGPMNVLGTLAVTVPGRAETPPTIDWDLECIVENGRLATPTPVEHVFGGVRLIGASGPRGAFSRGELAIDSAVIRGVQLTQITGPLVLDSQRVVFGASAERDVQNRAPRSITATAWLGQMSLDGELRLSAAGEFGVQVGLDSADLAAVVSELAPQQRGLSGRVFALVNVAGTLEGGVRSWTGDGQVRLRDADIYELPLMIRVLNVLSVQRPDGPAFTTSNIDFRIEGDDLALDRIDFNGDAICLKGKGRLTSQREVDLRFHPQLGRDEFQLPIFRPLVSETSRQFLLIEVTGTLDQTRVVRTVLPQLDERLAELFPELARDEPGQASRPSLFELPRLWPWR